VSSGLYSGVSGLALGIGLYKGVSGLWGGASGLIDGFGGADPFSGATLYLNMLSGSLDSRVTFTRSTTATFVGSNGLIQSAAINVPRFDYNPNTLAPLGLLIEETRTNLTLQTSDFTVAPWAACVSGTSTRVNDGSPLGFVRALVTATSAGGGIRQPQSSLASGQVYAMSFYIQSTSTAVSIVLENGLITFGATHSVVINPSNGTAGTLAGFTSVSVQPFGPGYIYTLVTAPAGGTLIANVEWRIVNSGDSMWIGRTQFEAGRFATSYIPTVAAPLPRNADIATMTGTNFSSWYNASEGTFFASFEASPNTFTTYLAASNGVVAQNSMHMDNDGSGNMRATYYSGSAPVAPLTLGVVGTLGAVNNMATAYKVNDFAASRNGGTAVVDTLGALPVGVVQLNIGADPSGAATNVTNTHIRQIAYFNTRLPNDRLEALTVLPPTLSLDFLNDVYEG
jgi:hypothetical protein